MIRRRQRCRIERYWMHDFRAYIFAKAPPPQRGLSAIAEQLVVVYHDSAKDKVIWSKTKVLALRD